MASSVGCWAKGVGRGVGRWSGRHQCGCCSPCRARTAVSRPVSAPEAPLPRARNHCVRNSWSMPAAVWMDVQTHTSRARIRLFDPAGPLVSNLSRTHLRQEEMCLAGGAIHDKRGVQRLVAGEIEEVVILAKPQSRGRAGGAEHDERAALEEPSASRCRRVGKLRRRVPHSLGRRRRRPDDCQQRRTRPGGGKRVLRSL